jgi:isocitrate dehydrogenase kinase/phosphatase
MSNGPIIMLKTIQELDKKYRSFEEMAKNRKDKLMQAYYLGQIDALRELIDLTNKKVRLDSDEKTITTETV